MPILKKDFERMARYGKAGQQAVLILKHRDKGANATGGNKTVTAKARPATAVGTARLRADQNPNR